jgi:hypothetical protein
MAYTEIVAIYRWGNIHKDWTDCIHILQDWALENSHATWSSSFNKDLVSFLPES